MSVCMCVSVCTCVWAYTCHGVQMQAVKGNMWESVLLCYHVGFGGSKVRLGRERLNPLSHLTGLLSAAFESKLFTGGQKVSHWPKTGTGTLEATVSNPDKPSESPRSRKHPTKISLKYPLSLTEDRVVGGHFLRHFLCGSYSSVL